MKSSMAQRQKRNGRHYASGVLLVVAAVTIASVQCAGAFSLGGDRGEALRTGGADSGDAKKRSFSSSSNSSSSSSSASSTGSTKNGAVIGGERAAGGVVSRLAVVVVSDGERSWVCSGSVLSATGVLTAANCFYGAEGLGAVTRVSVVVGVSRWRAYLGAEGGTVYNAARVYVHGRYDFETLQHDVAVILVRTPGFSAGSFEPVALPRNGRLRTPPGTVGTVAGYGRIRNTGRQAKVARQTRLRLQRVRNCRRRFVRAVWPTIKRREVLCATSPDTHGNGRQAFCDGDAGAPLFLPGPPGSADGAPGTQIGLASFTENTCSSVGATSWFTNLKHYAGDVRRLLGGNSTAWDQVLTLSAML